MVKLSGRSSTNLDIGFPYVIQIQGELDERWLEWFGAVQITIEHSSDHPPITTLHCPAMDQAKLRGVINKIWDLNLALVSVRQIPAMASPGEAVNGDPG